MKLRDHRLILRTYAARKKRLFEIRWGTVAYLTLGTVFTLVSLANAFGLHAEQPVPTTSSTMQPLVTTQPPQQTATTRPPVVLAEDTFQRPDDLQGWKRASDGQTWFGDHVWLMSIQQGTGVIAGTNERVTARLGPMTSNVDVTCTASISDFVQGQASVGAVVRYSGPNVWDKASLDGTQIAIIQHSPQGNVLLASVPFAASAGTMYSIRFRSNGQALDAKAWASGTPEPPDWMIHATDTRLHSGVAGIRVILAPNAIVRVTSFVAQSVSQQQ